MIFYILTALATTVIVGCPLLLLVGHLIGERDAAVRRMNQALDEIDALRVRVKLSQKPPQAPARILTPRDSNNPWDDRPAYTPEEPTDEEEKKS